MLTGIPKISPATAATSASRLAPGHAVSIHTVTSAVARRLRRAPCRASDSARPSRRLGLGLGLRLRLRLGGGGLRHLATGERIVDDGSAWLAPAGDAAHAVASQFTAPRQGP